eukprot:8755065-Heterocapsa_arctica.AAC.1
MPDLWPGRKLVAQDTLSELPTAAPDCGAGHDGIWSRRQRKRKEGSENGIPHGSIDVCEGQIQPRHAGSRWALNGGRRAPGDQEGDSKAPTGRTHAHRYGGVGG